MKRSIYFTLFLSLFIGIGLFAQVDVRDSVWVHEFLSRGGEFKLSDETIEAIRRGELTNSRAPARRFLMSSAELPIEREFENPEDNQGIFYNLDAFYISPSEIMLYQVEPDSFLIVQSAVLIDSRALLVKRYFRIPRSNVDVSISADNLFLPEVQMWDGEWEGSINGNIRVNFSLEEIFDPTERNKARNREKADAWKYYNMDDSE